MKNEELRYVIGYAVYDVVYDGLFEVICDLVAEDEFYSMQQAINVIDTSVYWGVHGYTRPSALQAFLRDLKEGSP